MTTYPDTRLGSDSVDLHGRSVPDPYRWLEVPDSDETRAWVEAQAAFAASHLDEAPSREAIRKRLTELWDYPKQGVPWRKGERWFQWRNSGLQDQMVLHVMTSSTDVGHVLLDPNTLSTDGTVAVGGVFFTLDGGLMAYAVSTSGSDWRTWHVRDVATGEDRPDVIEWAKLVDGVWKHDGSGFFYCGYEAPSADAVYTAATTSMRVLFHQLGTPASEDVVVYERPDEPSMIFAVQISSDGSMLVVTGIKGADKTTEIHALDLDVPGATFRPIVPEPTHAWGLIGLEGDELFFLTDLDASRQRIVKVHRDAPISEAVTVIPEGEHQLLGGQLLGGRLVVIHLVHASCAMAVHSLDGELLHDVPVPEHSTVVDLKGRPDDALVIFSVSSFSDPGSLWSHDVLTGETERIATSLAAFDGDQIVTEQVFVTSTDGTQIPVFVVHRADVTPTGDVPVWLYGYGGFNIPMTPAFSVQRALWVERGGIFALAVMRGGGEYGVEWHDGGRFGNKQQVFDDFMSAASWLHTSGWSNPSRIAINGGSNGGLLVGACLTQRQDLFAAVVCEVGVLDMLRFDQFTVGWAWVTDYGSPQDPEAFEWLLAYSPLHNVRPGTAYPPTLVMTGDHDDRVVPSHSYKFAAALQAAQVGEAPVLLRVELATGHGLGKPTSKVIDERTDVLAFMEQHLGVA